MILKVLYVDNSVQEFDLYEWRLIEGTNYLMITKKNIICEQYDVDTNETEVEVIPYNNIYKWWTVKKRKE